MNTQPSLLKVIVRNKQIDRVRKLKMNIKVNELMYTKNKIVHIEKEREKERERDRERGRESEREGDRGTERH